SIKRRRFHLISASSDFSCPCCPPCHTYDIDSGPIFRRQGDMVAKVRKVPYYTIEPSVFRGRVWKEHDGSRGAVPINTIQTISYARLAPSETHRRHLLNRLRNRSRPSKRKPRARSCLQNRRSGSSR